MLLAEFWHNSPDIYKYTILGNFTTQQIIIGTMKRINRIKKAQ